MLNREEGKVIFKDLGFYLEEFRKDFGISD